MKSAIGKGIDFFRGLPNFQEDLREIDPKYNNGINFDDLMAEGIEKSSFSVCLPKAAIVIPASYSCLREHVPKLWETQHRY